MSNPTNKEVFKQLLHKLLNEHKLSYDEIFAATGITPSVLKNAANDTQEEPRAFKASALRINALKAYLQKIENGNDMLPPEAYKTDEQIHALEQRVRMLEKQISELHKEKEGNGVN